MIQWSLRGRVILVCALSFAGGATVMAFGRSLFRDWWLSVFRNYALCTYVNGIDTTSTQCDPWTGTSQWLVGAGLLVGAVLLFWLFRLVARGIVRPITAMTDIVWQLGPQNLGQRIRYRGPRDEVRELADALDEMLNRVATGYEGQRRFASNASHELRTPLAVQRTLVEVAMVTGEQDMSRLAAQLLAVNERNERLIEGLLVLAESDRGLPGTEPVRFDTLVGEVLDKFAEQAEKNQVTLHRGMVARTVSGDPVLLDRMVSNLVHNAIKYNVPGGAIEVVVAAEPTLSIHNTGQQVPAETVPALWEPFRRLTAERTNQRDGAGLGMSIVRSIVTAHNGTVSAAPGDHGGLKVTVKLP
ncbi:HAMP domain-containing sensor histidine kinase [Actinophytocola sp.]|uniref:sensor histidine kinase n=1 Tax=Actinophytocola sp. TaxID=1872138 RepID=UPI002ED6B144